MLWKSCTLCGGRLNSNGVCVECGLDNKKTDAIYVINKSDCDKKPLTHIHEEKQPDWKKPSPAKSKKVKGNDSYYKKRIILIVSIVVGFYLVIGIVAGIIYKISDSNENWIEEEVVMDLPDDPYAYVTREIPSEGEVYSIELRQGEYVVGAHIPEGIYTCHSAGAYAEIDVEDDENCIWLYEWVEDGNEILEDIRLYEGAKVIVRGISIMTFETENAQMDGLELPENGLPEGTVYVSDGDVAGIHFLPGVYDIAAKKGEGQIVINIYDEDESELQWIYLWLSANHPVESEYCNLVLPPNAEIVFEDFEGTLALTPSEGEATTDYIGYYY